MEWLELLGYAHGNLRPANILLDAGDTIKVGGFDSTVRIGTALHPFASWKGITKPQLAGAVSEQYAVGSCIYNIRTGHEPFHDIDGPMMVRELMNNEFPPTSNDGIFGDVVLRCWRGSYQSISELEQAIILTHFRGACEKREDRIGGACVNTQDCSRDVNHHIDQALVSDCEVFLRQQRR